MILRASAWEAAHDRESVIRSLMPSQAKENWQRLRWLLF
jgi:hypothetical protein